MLRVFPSGPGERAAVRRGRPATGTCRRHRSDFSKSPVGSIADADTAIFYSISNCQKGLRGINFGNFLIKQVVDELHRELPQLKRFSTLSPVPGFRKWLTTLDVGEIRAALGGQIGQLLALADTRDVIPAREFLIEAADEEASDRITAGILLRACAHFLTTMPEVDADPVAKFHIGNGARLERFNPAADDSAKGRMQSFGLMVNYLYEPGEIVANHQDFASPRRVHTSREIARLLADHPAETRPASPADAQPAYSPLSRARWMASAPNRSIIGVESPAARANAAGARTSASISMARPSS